MLRCHTGPCVGGLGSCRGYLSDELCSSNVLKGVGWVVMRMEANMTTVIYSVKFWCVLF